MAVTLAIDCKYINFYGLLPTEFRKSDRFCNFAWPLQRYGPDGNIYY